MSSARVIPIFHYISSIFRLCIDRSVYESSDFRGPFVAVPRRWTSWLRRRSRPTRGWEGSNTMRALQFGDLLTPDMVPKRPWSDTFLWTQGSQTQWWRRNSKLPGRRQWKRNHWLRPVSFRGAKYQVGQSVSWDPEPQGTSRKLGLLTNTQDSMAQRVPPKKWLNGKLRFLLLLRLHGGEAQIWVNSSWGRDLWQAKSWMVESFFPRFIRMLLFFQIWSHVHFMENPPTTHAKGLILDQRAPNLPDATISRS